MRIARVLGLLATASVAQAQITPIPTPFTGVRQEGFVGLANWSVCIFCPSIPGAFQGICDLESVEGSNIHITGMWVWVCSQVPHGGDEICGSSGGGGFDYHFSAGNEAGMFGGFFGTNSGVPGGTAEFYKADGTLLGTEPLTFPADCSWTWQGWSFDAPVARIRIIGNEPYGGYVIMDDMEYSPPAPDCYPDCNQDGALTVSDFGCFQTKFVAGDPYADCNGDGLFTVADFGCFQTEFVSGCT